MMGVKGRAALAIFFIIIFFGSLWFYGGLDGHKDYCFKIYIQKDQSVNSSKNNTSNELVKLEVCPGQKFQVAFLLMNLQAAPVSSSDVMLKPYLASWDELIKFMEALGPMVGLISQEIESKTSIIRKLAEKEDEDRRQQVLDSSVERTWGGAYSSVRSMIAVELDRGTVDFDMMTDSGCRTLLRLHRALLWLQLFLQNLADENQEAMARKPSQLCRAAYRVTLAQHHSWWVRNAAELAFSSMPERQFFYKLMCVKTQAEAVVVLRRVVGAIQEVYNRTQAALEEHEMLALP
ncbi:glycolipid transfer protein domain-containing protein 2 [Trichomycterus rosablanca]|uniref:glycolipid transfer protein domain-containing protein 2 n=1 Tax=Trichomycterus rosablanca TaxID=2290929 RepID=UPI002F350CFC